MVEVSDREAAVDLRRELRRSVWLLRLMVAAGVAGAMPALFSSDEVASRRLLPLMVGALLLTQWAPRWWCVERAWRATRGLAEAVPVAVTTPRWSEGVQITEAGGSSWRWRLLPLRLFSAHVPAPGDRAWVDAPIRAGSRPVVLVYAGDRRRPRASVALRPATEAPPSS